MVRITPDELIENGFIIDSFNDGYITFSTKEKCLSEVKEKYGPDALGFLASSRCTNEDVYAIQKLARAVIGTNNVHSCAAT